MKVVKRLACVWHWCGINLDWVYSLNHCTSSSFVAQELPRFLGKSFISRGFWNVVMRHPYAHPQHIRFVKHLACFWNWCGINLDWVYSLNHCTSPSFVAQEIPRFLGVFPKLCQQRLMECCYNTSKCASTAYEGCQTPFMCLTLI